MSGLIRFIHLLSAAVWIGGLLTLGVLVSGLRRSGAHREDLRAMARSFNGLWWGATFVSLFTGGWYLFDSGGLPTGDTGYAQRFLLKMALLGVAMAMAVIHTMTARSASPRSRGMLQAGSLFAGLGVLGAAVWLAS